MSVHQHKHESRARRPVRLAVITVSDTRTEETDEGGRLLRDLGSAAGHAVVEKVIVRDEPAEVSERVRALAAGGTVDAVLLTGGTGISRRDTTVEALAGLFDKTLEGYGELFRWLSYQEVGAAAMLSRAIAGTIGAVAVFLMPGSPAAVRLAMEKLILPEIGHVVAQLTKDVAPRHDDRDKHG